MLSAHAKVWMLHMLLWLWLSLTQFRLSFPGAQGQFPIVQNMTVTEGGIANLTCRVEHNDNTSLQWSNPAQQTLFFGDKKGEWVIATKLTGIHIFVLGVIRWTRDLSWMRFLMEEL